MSTLPSWANGGGISTDVRQWGTTGGTPIAETDVYPGNPNGQIASVLTFDDGRLPIYYVPGQFYQPIAPPSNTPAPPYDTVSSLLSVNAVVRFYTSDDGSTPNLDEVITLYQEDAYLGFEWPEIDVTGISSGLYGHFEVLGGYLPFKLTYQIRTYNEDATITDSDEETVYLSANSGWEHVLEPVTDSEYINVTFGRLLPFSAA